MPGEHGLPMLRVDSYSESLNAGMPRVTSKTFFFVVSNYRRLRSLVLQCQATTGIDSHTETPI